MKEKTVREWVQELAAAKKRESNFRHASSRVVKIYEAERSVGSGEADASVPFNILYSNTETLSPALYNSPPRPKVARRFLDEDPLGRDAAQLTQRVLEFLLDNDLVGYSTFDEMMQTAVTQALVPGRGVVRVKYEAEAPAQEAVDEVVEGMEGEDSPGGEGGRFSETVVCEIVPWDRFLHGYAAAWAQVPWISILHLMTKEEVEENFGKEKAAALPFSDPPEGEVEEKRAPGNSLIEVYEIWDKGSKQVIFLAEGHMDDFLKVVDDPLGLTGFFPIPQPLTYFRRISSLTPTAPYTFYEDQARELNQVTIRIRRIIAALRVRGFYDATIAGIDKLLTADDNTFLPATNAAALPQGQNLEKALFIMPIEKLVAVVQQLYLQRQQIKQVIYDITGIADIMRGSTQASETLGAQQIKSQWGTLRLKKAQKETARFARDTLRLMAEVAVTKFDPQTLLAMTGLPIPTAEQKQQQQMQMQLQAQQAMMMGQQPPPMQPLPPSIEELQGMLQSDLMRAFKIDIETNSTVELEATQDKEEMAELMNGIAQFMNGVAPAVAQGILPFEVGKSMLLGVVRRYRFGEDVEKALQEMKPPPPKQDTDPKNSPEVIQAETQSHVVKAQTDLKMAEQEAQFRAQEHQLKMEELEMKKQMMVMKFELEMRKMEMQAMMGNSPGLTNNNPGGEQGEA